MHHQCWCASLRGGADGGPHALSAVPTRLLAQGAFLPTLSHLAFCDMQQSGVAAARHSHRHALGCHGLTFCSRALPDMCECALSIYNMRSLSYSLTELDLSNNLGITGELPPQLALLPRLQVVKMMQTGASCAGITKLYVSCAMPAPSHKHMACTAMGVFVWSSAQCCWWHHLGVEPCMSASGMMPI